jgi:ATP-dependent RNA helicase SUPV3L1/SUV3
VLAAGRTSVVTDASFERMFYKLAGFRFLGKRAVRIDILERLADLIRPLLQWKPGQQPRPEGAYDGRRFTTTTAMLSILGATLDDMEEILKGLGYRADQVTAEEAQAFLASHAGASAPVAAEAATAEEESIETEEHEPASEEQVSETATVAEGEAAEAPVAEAASEEAAAAEAASENAEAAEPKPVLLWRPGGRNENQRGENRRPGNRGQGRGEGAREQGERRGEGRPGNRDGANREAANRSGDGERKRDGGRPDRGNNRNNDRHDRGERKDRLERNDRGGKPQGQQRFEAKPPRKEKPLDPDSPFAKLASLKEPLKK